MNTQEAGAKLMESTDGSGWIATAVMAIITAVTSAMAYLFKLNESKSMKAIDDLKCQLKDREEEHKDLLTRSTKCEEDRAKLDRRVAILETKLGIHDEPSSNRS